MTVNKGIFMDCTLKTFNLKTYFLKFKNTESCLTKMAQSEQKVTSKRPSSCVNSHKSSHWEPMINIVHSPWFTETEFREKRTCFPAQWKPALSSNSLLFLSFFLSTPPPTHSRLLLAYSHPQLPWVEREADKESSEADIPSLTAQKENNSNDHSLITSVEGLDRVWVPRSINREHELFWMQDKHQISQQVLVYWDIYTTGCGTFSRTLSDVLHYCFLNSSSTPKGTADYVPQVSNVQGGKSYCCSAQTAGSQ